MVEIIQGNVRNGKLRQFFVAVIVNVGAICQGISCGWPSPMIPLLRDNVGLFASGPMSEEGISWINSIFCLGALLTAPFSDAAAERLGRKLFGYATGLVLIAGYLVLIFATGYGCIYAARFVIGAAGGMLVYLVPVYVGEIASEEIRGALSSLFLFGINTGILLAFVAGPFLSYTMFNVYGLAFAVFFLGTFFFVPETPVFLVRKGRVVEAKKSLMFLRGDNELLVNKSLSELQSQVDETMNSSVKLNVLYLFKDRATCKGMIIVLGLLAGQQLCGIFAMITYAEMIFKMSGSKLSPEIAAIVIGAIQLFGSYLSTSLMERAGRRPLILASCAGTCACQLTMGTFLCLQDSGRDLSAVSWIPVVALSVYMIAYCLGSGPMPFVLASEIFSVDVTSLASNYSLIFLWVVSFVVVKCFSPMITLIGIDGCFFLLGAFCAGNFVFSYLLVPETKGRRREDIVHELAGCCSRPTGLTNDEKVYIKDKKTNYGNSVETNGV